MIFAKHVNLKRQHAADIAHDVAFALQEPITIVFGLITVLGGEIISISWGYCYL